MTENKQFGQRLSQGVISVANRQYKNKNIVEQEIAELLGCSHFNVRRWQRGFVPDDPQRVAFLAEYCVKHGFVGRAWAESFLHHASYYGKENLLASLFPEQTSPRPVAQKLVYQNLPSIYGDFVGREEALQRVVEGLLSRWPLVSIEGMAGIGKTTLAIVVGRACLPGGDACLDEPFEACIFISAKDIMLTLNTFLDRVAYELNYPRISQQPFSAEKPAEVQKLLRQYRVLLIADNLETVTDQNLIRFLRDVPEPSKVLITTRWSQVRGTWDVSLEGLAQEDALRLIRQHARRLQLENLIQATGEALKDLVMVTGGNPYAIEMALGHLRYNRSLTAERQENAVKKLVNALYVADRELDDLFDRMFKWAWEDDVLNAEARCLLLATPFFVDSATAEALGAAAGVEGYYLTKALRQLGEMSLLKENAAGRYSVHPLTRAFAARKLREVPDWERRAQERWMNWHAALLRKHGGMRARYVDWADLEILGLEHKNISEVLQRTLKQRHPLCIQLAQDFWYFLYIRGHWQECLEVTSDVLEQMSNEDNDLVRLWLLAHRGWLLVEMGHFNLAIESLYQVKKEIERQGNTSWMQETGVLNFLGQAYMIDEQFEQTVLFEQEYVRLSQENDDLAGTITGRYYLAITKTYRGQTNEAEQELRGLISEAQNIGWERAEGYCAYRLAEVLLELDLLQEAEDWLVYAYQMAERWNEPQLQAHVLFGKAKLLLKRKQTIDACARAKESLDLYRRVGARDHNRAARLVSDLDKAGLC